MNLKVAEPQPDAPASMRSMPMRRLTSWGLRSLFAGVLLGMAVVAWPASSAGASGTVTATFTINGRALAHAGSSNPIKLNPTTPADVKLTVNNSGTSAITVDAVALTGRALGITFFNFQTQTALPVQPGASATQEYSLNFSALNGQGDGLIPASLQLLDAHNHVLASQSFTADVRGRITSLFGLFAIEVTVFTAILFAGCLLALARGKLHENRFRRGLRFLWTGLGLGIVIVFALAILRVFVPAPGHWLPIVLLCAVIGFVVGYLTPNPANDEYVELDPSDPANPASPAADPRATLPVSGG
jgi:hypothetical protein